MTAADPVLLARPDGQLACERAVTLPVMAPRLQADLEPDGRLVLALWGSGTLATLRFEGWSGPYVLGPNRLLAPGGGLHVAQSRPVAVLRGTRLVGLRPARRCAWWGAAEPARPVRRDGARRIAETGWGVVVAETRGDDVAVAVGADLGEALDALTLTTSAVVAEADAHVARCDGLPEADPELRSMVSQGLHAALSSIRRDERGAFAGLAAGQAYSAPARTYYRDGYWTQQALLPICPEILADQIELLARGVRDDGEAPSAVILTGPAQSAAWEAVRRSDPRIKEEHLRPGDWWSDHFDSPLFFVLTIGDHFRATGDDGPLRRHVDKIRAILARYERLAAQGDGLPPKPRHDRDWADNVYRSGYVAYDVGLWIGALDVVADLGRRVDPALAERAAGLAALARRNLDGALLRPSGWYADYADPADGFVEEHLTLDSLTLLRFDAVSPERAAVVLDAVHRRLESRANGEQPYGDWGVMCAYPPFARRADTRAKSAFAYRYHNGSDWPYLSGLYAGERLRRGLPGWRYPLTRWWRSCLDQGWAGAVEYFSPPFGRGSLLQGWSAMPAAVAVTHGRTVLAGG